MHIIGLGLILVSFVFSVNKETGKKFNYGWLIAALGGLFFSGMVVIMQKLFTNEYTQYKMDNFLCVAFIFIIIMCAVAMFFAKSQQNSNNEEGEVKTTAVKQYGFTIALGGVMGLVNKINIFLSGVLPSVLVFPVINGGVILATAITSAFVFKEKLSIRRKLGLIIGILGIVSITIAKAIA